MFHEDHHTKLISNDISLRGDLTAGKVVSYSTWRTERLVVGFVVSLLICLSASVENRTLIMLWLGKCWPLSLKCLSTTVKNKSTNLSAMCEPETIVAKIQRVRRATHFYHALSVTLSFTDCVKYWLSRFYIN